MNAEFCRRQYCEAWCLKVVMLMIFSDLPLCFQSRQLFWWDQGAVLAVFIRQSCSVTAWCLQMVAASTCSSARSSWSSGTDEGSAQRLEPFPLVWLPSSDRLQVETHVALAQPRLCLDKVASEWAGDEECISKRVRCQTLEEKRKFVTFALKNVNHSTIPSTKTGRKKKDKPRTLVPADKTIHIREDGPTVHLCGDSEVAVKWINGQYALGQKNKGLATFKRRKTHAGKERSRLLRRQLPDQR